MHDHRPAGRGPSVVRRHLSNLLGSDSGNVAIYVGLAMPVFLGAAGLAVDATSWYTTKRSVQNGVDAAAYAAALNLASQGLVNTPDLTAIQAAADDAASRNGLATPVTVTYPGTSLVEVNATSDGWTPFTGMFFASAPTIPARAVAKATVADACIWSLHPTAQGAFNASGSAQVELSCGVVVNSNHEQAALQQTGSSCVTATSVSVHGGYSGTCVNPEPEVFAPDYGDPLAHLTAPTYGACDYPSQVVVDAAMTAAHGGGPVPLNPGVYCDGIVIEANQEAIFAPGLYVLETGEFRIAGNAIVSNTENASGGVTFYLTGSGTDYAYLTFESGANITLTPMTTGPLANVLFYQDRNAPASTACGTKKNDPSCHLVAGGATMDLTGILYFPSQHAQFTGGSSTTDSDILLVANTVTFTGNSYLNADYAKSVLPQNYYVRLVE